MTLPISNIVFTRPPPSKLHAVVERITFKFPPFPIRIEVQAHGEARIIIVVPSRDSGRTVEVNHPTGLYAADIERSYIDEKCIELEIRRAVKRVFVHEAMESYHLDGERVEDPHAEENTWYKR